MGKISIKIKISHPVWYSCICALAVFYLQITTLHCCHERRRLNSFDSLYLVEVKVNYRMSDMENNKYLPS